MAGIAKVISGPTGKLYDPYRGFCAFRASLSGCGRKNNDCSEKIRD